MRAGRRPSSRYPLKQADSPPKNYPRLRTTSRSDTAQEKFHRASDTVGEFVWTREIDRPLPDDGAVEPFHELRQVDDRKRARHFAPLLPLRQDFTQQAGGSLLVPSEFRGSHRIHGAG